MSGPERDDRQPGATHVPPRAVFTRCVDAQALAQAGAGAIAAAAARALAAHGEFRLALSGGRTPHDTYLALAELALDWSRVHVFFSDERCVPPDHRDSNFARANAALLQRVPVPPAHVHRMRGELEPHAGAAHYDALLQRTCTGARTLDLCLLGLGGDGHTASLFPGSPALAEHERSVVAAAAPPGVEPPWRLTLTYPCLARSQDVLFLVAGADKAPVIAALRRDAGAAYPAARVRAQGQVRFLVSGEAWGA